MNEKMLNWIIIFKISINSLARNKFRSFLTLLGIILGIASVVTMYNLGLGMQSKIEDELAGLGTNIIVISTRERQSGLFKKTQAITVNDMEAIEDNSNKVAKTIPFISSYVPITYKNSEEEGFVLGTTSEYFLIGDKVLQAGYFFGPVDVSNASNVCVVGYELTRKLFKSQDPIGQTIVANKVPLNVIGVLDEYPVFSVMDPVTVNDSLFIPYTTAYHSFNISSTGAKGELHSLLIIVRPDEDIYKAKAEIENLLRQRYHVPSDKKDVFAIDTMDEYTQLRKRFTSSSVIFLKIIAFIALFVGGINIMNIMLVTVRERTREIGVRMAMGARPKDIIFQFLAESVFLCFWGGLVGVVLSIPLSLFMANMAMHIPVKFSFGMVVVALLYSSAVGIIFGIYPARKASLKDPIESLRYE